ncbi:MAG: DUF1036 domain-containing protein [Methylobacteriaceae bacterium]|nr:DUF1036 domain-containing protein [Methylobacteriaceae bacterium]
MNRTLPAALAALLALASSAQAELRICNQTGNTVQVALGYLAEKTWTTEGWWNIRSHRCVTLLRGPLAARFYYIYAEDTVTGGGWIGQTLMCVKETEFTIRGVADCYAAGYDRKPFREIDTRNLRNWTIQLTDIDRSEEP